MAQRSRPLSDDVWFPVIILVGAVVWAYRAQIVHLVYISVGIVICLLLAKLSWIAFRHRQFTWSRSIDSMSGLDFERYVASLLRANGYRKVSLTERYDYGVDIIAEKDGIRWGIQAKRYSSLVKADAIREVVTGLKMYGCDRAMVITNSNYSAIAQRLANANDCVLIDRARLKRLTRQGSIL